MRSVGDIALNFNPSLCKSKHEKITVSYLFYLQVVPFDVHFRYTVEPQSSDHLHQRPSLLYDHISSDGQCFLFVRSLTDDHPSNAFVVGA